MLPQRGIQEVSLMAILVCKGFKSILKVGVAGINPGNKEPSVFVLVCGVLYVCGQRDAERALFGQRQKTIGHAYC